jgi:hypothetical protein
MRDLWELLGNFWFLVFLTVIVTSVVYALTEAWQKVRRAELETALKRQMLDRGLTVAEMEQLLRASPRSSPPAPADGRVVEKVAETLAEHQAPPQVIEQVLIAVRRADPGTQQAIHRAIEAVVAKALEEDEPANAEAILAFVRGLSTPVERAPAAEQAAVPQWPPHAPSVPGPVSGIKAVPDLPSVKAVQS